MYSLKGLRVQWKITTNFISIWFKIFFLYILVHNLFENTCRSREKTLVYRFHTVQNRSMNQPSVNYSQYYNTYMCGGGGTLLFFNEFKTFLPQFSFKHIYNTFSLPPYFDFKIYLKTLHWAIILSLRVTVPAGFNSHNLT